MKSEANDSKENRAVKRRNFFRRRTQLQGNPKDVQSKSSNIAIFFDSLIHVCVIIGIFLSS